MEKSLITAKNKNSLKKFFLENFYRFEPKARIEQIKKAKRIYIYGHGDTYALFPLTKSARKLCLDHINPDDIDSDLILKLTPEKYSTFYPTSYYLKEILALFDLLEEKRLDFGVDRGLLIITGTDFKAYLAPKINKRYHENVIFPF